MALVVLSAHGSWGDAAQEVTLSGEVVDLHCYLTRGARGPGHAGCANACIGRGVTPGFVAEDGRVFLLLAEKPFSVKDEVAGLAGQTVMVRGTAVERDGLRGLQLKAIARKAASIAGKVSYKGPVPAPSPAGVSADAYCQQEHDQRRQRQRIQVKDGGLANALVYVKNVTGSYPAPTEAVILDQRRCEYQPHVLALQIGQPLKILNSDETYHNLHPRPAVNIEFNEAQPRKGMEKLKQFDKKELMMPVGCDVHPWMRAYISVLDHLRSTLRPALPPLSPLVHLHGATFTCWVLLFVTQTVLVARRRVEVHRRLGVAGAVLAAAVVVIGLTTAIATARKGVAAGDPGALPFLAIPVVDMLVFAGLVAVGVYYRHRLGAAFMRQDLILRRAGATGSTPSPTPATAAQAASPQQLNT